ncbi:polysaccharide deacetylase [Staphylococcus capitis]|nr:polysaccharide deacetylase [Staphylococcus capitis]
MRKTLYLFFVSIVLMVFILEGCSKQKDSHTEDSENENMYASHQSKMTKDWQTYDGEIYHIFYHPLITDAKVAFSGSPQEAKGNNDWMITANEFKKSLEELHKRNYILIDPHDAYDLKAKTINKKKLKLPKGKKPLILSIDDMNYYEYMRGKGYADRLVLDKNKHVVSETKQKNGKVTHSKDDDIVPILNDFVKKHPDFSLNGQKGVVALTGYNGVLGYRTNETDSKHYKDRKAKATEVADAMKRDGWTFASHSNGHINFEQSSYEGIVKDTKRWEKEVTPIIGKTDLFIFPHGAQDRDTPAYNYLIKEGHFKYLAGVGPNNFTDVEPDNVYQDRVAVDGLNLYDFKDKLKPFMNPEKVYDKQDRSYFKGNKDYQQE